MKHDRAIAVVIVVMTGLAIIGGYFFIVSGAFVIFYPKPPKPAIEYAEVPFELTYEVNGEEKVIADTIICEFDGFSRNTAGSYRNWKTSLKSGNEDIVLLDVRPENQLAWDKYPILEFFFLYGNAEYYMDREYGQVAERQSLNELYFRYQYGEKIDFSVMTADEAWERFKLRLISWEESPIQTTVND